MPPNSFFFSQQPNVEITFEDKIITSIIGTRNDGTKVNNTNVKNPRNRKSISLEVLDTPIVNKLRAKPFLFKKIPQSNERVKRFIKVVEIFVELATETGSWSGKDHAPDHPFTGDGVWKKVGLSEYNNIVKFLFVADQVGFYDLEKRARKEYKAAEPTDIKKRRQESDLSEFEKDEYVGNWLGNTYKPNDPDADQYGWVKSSPKFKDKPADARTLWQALILLDMTTEEFLAGTKDSKLASEIKDKPERKIKALTDRLEQKTFQPVGLEKEAFNPTSLFEWTNMTEIPIETDIEKLDKEGNPTGKMVRVTFAQPRDGRFDPSNMGVLKKLTKAMRHFAESNGITGAWTQLWSQKTPSSKHGELDIDIHYLKDFEDCLRKGVEFDENGEFIMMEKQYKKKRNDKVSGQKRQIEYPDTELTPDQYKGKVIRYQKGDKLPLILPNGNVIAPDQQYYDVKKIVTTDKDWKSAFMYFKVAMDLGWRAEEAFTSGANKSESKNETGIKMEKMPDKINPETEEVTEEGEKFLTLRIMTRKTAHVQRGMHGGAVITKETMQMLLDKRALVEKYSDETKYTREEALEHGVVQTYIDRSVDESRLKMGEDGKWKGLPEDFNKPVTNKIHALVGEDGYFTAIGTMDLPSNALMRKDERKRYKDNHWQVPEVKKIDKNRDKLKAIMRHCYAEIFSGDKADMYDKYFKFHALHALRHLFAQYWLKASAIENGGVRDFAMVMKMGHWGGIDVLMNFYGQSSNIQVTKRAMKLQKTYEELEFGEAYLKKQAKVDEKVNKDLDEVDEQANAEESGDEINPDTGNPTQKKSLQVEDDKQ